MPSADYVIVGAGSAGCVLAHRPPRPIGDADLIRGRVGAHAGVAA